jgi:transposase-like protein
MASSRGRGKPRARIARPKSLCHLPTLKRGEMLCVYAAKTRQRLQALAATEGVSMEKLSLALGFNLAALYKGVKFVRTTYGLSLAELLGEDILHPTQRRLLRQPQQVEPLKVAPSQLASPPPSPAPLPAPPEPAGLSPFELMVYRAKLEKEQEAQRVEHARKRELKDLSKRADLELDGRRKEHKQLREQRP